MVSNNKWRAHNWNTKQTQSDNDQTTIRRLSQHNRNTIQRRSDNYATTIRTHKDNKYTAF
eukprot:384993-Heterocapsa_arctica.AAC.1